MSNSNGRFIAPIGHIYTDFSEKFGIPRQSGLGKSLLGRIVFEPTYRTPEAFRALEGFSHVWVIWGFSEADTDHWHATVRPPRLGGNKRVGVFASRSPFRPNGLGLSCVRLESVDMTEDGPVLTVSGIDMLSGTPVYDIKPYVPIADCRPEASAGYTEQTSRHLLSVVISDDLKRGVPQCVIDALTDVLSHDPRPGYDDSPEKEYGLSVAGYGVGFRVEEGRAVVFRINEEK